MKTFRVSRLLLPLALTTAAFVATAHAGEPPATPSKQPSEAEMMAQMTELAKPGEHHQQLAALAGNWTYTVKMSMNPGDALAEAGHGTASRKSIMGGRYFMMDVNGKVLMPGPDGKAGEIDFSGMAIDAYDNVKHKFVSSWIDSMGTSITLSEGNYDPAAKTFTYDFDFEPVPGVRTKARQTVKIIDANHNQMDWYESRAGQLVKTMEIDYVRAK